MGKNRVMEARVGRAIASQGNRAEKPLTARQQEILDFIKLFAETRGHPPTRHEIALGFGWASDNAAEQHLRLIAAKGHIQIINGTSRGIMLTTK
jgi:repressor LexA